MSLRYLTAGESHGEALLGILDGMPSGLHLSAQHDIDPFLRERQKGYGRSHRQKIENDEAKIISGVRFGITTGAPIAVMIRNKDWDNWQEQMAVDASGRTEKPVTIPRPGHADLAGGFKYGHSGDLRNVFERASARETAMRVALGAIANKLLAEVGIMSVSYVRAIGTVTIAQPPLTALPELSDRIRRSALRSPEPGNDETIKQKIDAAKEAGDTLGGVAEAAFVNVPVGIGSAMQWDRKLDAMIASAVMSIQAVKAVEIGDGRELAARPGSAAHDAILVDNGAIKRGSNHAGGIEGGMSNGEPIIVRAAMKPISTLMQPLPSVELGSGRPTSAHIERSDVCAVPALSVIVEQVVAMVIAQALLETFSGDTVGELRERVDRRHASFRTSRT